MRFIVTAGPTREHIDPVRFLSNPSTGRMGFAVARAARDADHEVTLIAGPVALKTPRGVRRVDVVSARDMLAAVQAELNIADANPRRTDAINCVPPVKSGLLGGAQLVAPANATVLVMTAAVADWRPARCAPKKLKKSQMADTIRLVRNPDILKTLSRLPAKERPVLVGFAAETGNAVAEAGRKCHEKKLSLIVANDVTAPGAGFAVDTNRVAFVFPNGTAERLPLMTKRAVARRVVAAAESQLLRF